MTAPSLSQADRRQPRRGLPRRVRRLPVPVALVALALAAATGVTSAGAAFTAAVNSTGNSVAAAASFPNYPTSVGTSQWAYHRLEQAPSSAGTLAVADTSTSARPGTLQGPTNGPSTRYDLDETTGPAADSSGAANRGTLGSGATWNAAGGRTAGAVNLDGTTNGYVEAIGSAVKTDASFTVSAWVYLTGAALPVASGAVLSQDGVLGGGTVGGFELMYHSGKKWKMYFPQTYASNPAFNEAVSVADAVPQTWTHVVGVYDSAAAAGSQIKLYVNAGTPTTAGRVTPWNATGALQVGRARYNSGYTDAFPGRVDDVRTFRRALSAAEVSALYGGDAALAWNFDEGVESVVTDYSGAGRAGTRGSAATWSGTANARAGNAVTFANDATNGYVEGAAAVQTNASFSVAAWVYLDPAGATGSSRTAVSQWGGTVAGFFLQYRPATTKWVMTMPRGDATNLGSDTLSALANATTGSWVHLVGIYNDEANTIGLYINGVTQNTIPRLDTHEWDANLSTQVGRGRWTTAGDPFYGRIDGVRLYQRALTQAEVTSLYTDAEPQLVSMTAGLPGALQGPQKGLQATTAVAFAGATNGYNNAQVASPGPTPFTIECWVKTTSTTGGQLMAFTAERTGIVNAGRDRMLYVDSGNRVTFGTYVGSAVTVRSTGTVNDGAWHHVAASVGSAGLRLYVDGLLVDDDPTTTTSAFAGYWRFGGGRIGGPHWPSAPATENLTGMLDEVSIYPTQLSDQQIAWNYYSNY
ncbi:MAG TPA: LamG domain-containing protein [Pilimelia sp.]|nr:LamG domain-containing protein [Pilimelia sp.]